MIRGATSIGWTIAADNLKYFLSGKGGVKNIDSDWLRTFSSVQRAEQKSINYYLADFKKIASEMNDGETKFLNECPGDLSSAIGPFGNKGWAAKETGEGELYYASGTFTVTAFCNVSITKENGRTKVKGTMNLVWWDPYDWHNGLTAFVPGFGNVKDSDANFLMQQGKAKDFSMRSNWTVDYEIEF